MFGEQSFEQDFLYQLDIQQAHAAGVLSHVDTLFHEQQPEATLATPLLVQGSRLLDWLARGAHLYLCGDRAELDACEAALEGYLDNQQGKGQWKQLAKDKRIHRNLY